jgi:hypothetical protein
MAARAQDYQLAAVILRCAVGGEARMPTREEEASYDKGGMLAVVRDLYELGQGQAASLLEHSVDPRGKDCDFVLDPLQIETAIKRLEAFL